MTMIKSYSDLQQSKKLAEILPLESADMYYYSYMSIGEPFYMNYPNVIEDGQKLTKNDIRCWSLAALLGVLPKSLIYTPNQALDGYCCKNIMHDLETYRDNPVDACYEMIIKLNELKML